MRSILKTVSWLAVSWVLIGGCAWYECGCAKTAFFAAMWACLLKTPVYWGHEVAWNRN